MTRHHFYTLWSGNQALTDTATVWTDITDFYGLRQGNHELPTGADIAASFIAWWTTTGVATADLRLWDDTNGAQVLLRPGETDIDPAWVAGDANWKLQHRTALTGAATARVTMFGMRVWPL